MSTAIFLFRNDLRLADNAALFQAAKHDWLIPIYIFENGLQERVGGASRWWLYHSLASLSKDLNALGSQLVLQSGHPKSLIPEIARQTNADHIYWNRGCEPERIERDKTTEAFLTKEIKLKVQTHPNHLWFEPGEIQRPSGGPYRVFTAFWKACLAAGLDSGVMPTPDHLPPVPRLKSLALDSFGLLPKVHWDKGLADNWTPGETGAAARLARFIEHGLKNYPEHRDRPDLEGTSCLSPHLHFGEITPRQIALAVQRFADGQPAEASGAESLLRQLGWREFAHHLLYHFPRTVSQPLNEKFSRFPWRTDYADDLKRWQQGRTGIPLVDAGMRQLWTTGWMHNRVRMVVASLLTKNLLIPWQEGAAWFHDTLVDADPANNIMGWQWVAGSGADAAPYFRIFNPVRQGQRFDPQGDYVRRWVPELTEVPSRYIHEPWKAPQSIKDIVSASGDFYLTPSIDLAFTRDRALKAYRHLRD